MKLSEKGKKRLAASLLSLRVLRETSDGLLLVEQDLALEELEKHFIELMEMYEMFQSVASKH